ncbi:MAG: helix-turn-helix domain-containing protein [Candidatus Omnitrophica bacterium]|nr:helix-turn-helix domain-containing protein [Candidatus Omnitrophota bacterium]
MTEGAHPSPFSAHDLKGQCVTLGTGSYVERLPAWLMCAVSKMPGNYLGPSIAGAHCGSRAGRAASVEEIFFSIREGDAMSYNMTTENDKQALKYIDEGNLGYALESISEVAEFYGKSFKTIEYWIRSGLPREKIGTKQYVYPLRDINSWLLERNVLDLPRNIVDILRCEIAESEAVSLRQFLYVDLPALIKKADVEELARVIRERTLDCEHKAIVFFKEAVKRYGQIDLPERE